MGFEQNRPAIPYQPEGLFLLKTQLNHCSKEVRRLTFPHPLKQTQHHCKPETCQLGHHSSR